MELYDEYSKEFRTGDILLFDNTHWLKGFGIFAHLIKYFTKSSWNHVGIVIRNPKFTEDKMEGLFIWESSKEPFVDAEDGKMKLGVSVSDLRETLLCCKGKIVWRKLNLLEPLDEKKLKEIHDLVNNKPYDINPIDWWRAYMKKDPNPQRTNSVWCSALVALIYTKLGLLPSDTDWSIIAPSFFSEENKDLKLIDASLNNEIVIKDD